MICPTCDGLGQVNQWIATAHKPTRVRCPDCGGSGGVRGVCWECGEPLRSYDNGDVCLECVEHTQAIAYLDTRPEDRRARARERWLDACTLINFARWKDREPEYEGETRALLARAERAWRWYVLWDAAVCR